MPQAVQVVYYERAPVVIPCDSEDEAKRLLDRIKAAIANDSEQEIRLDETFSVSLENARSASIVTEQ